MTQRGTRKMTAAQRRVLGALASGNENWNAGWPTMHALLRAGWVKGSPYRLTPTGRAALSQHETEGDR